MKEGAQTTQRHDGDVTRELMSILQVAKDALGKSKRSSLPNLSNVLELTAPSRSVDMAAGPKEPTDRRLGLVPGRGPPQRAAEPRGWGRSPAQSQYESRSGSSKQDKPKQVEVSRQRIETVMLRPKEPTKLFRSKECVATCHRSAELHAGWDASHRGSAAPVPARQLWETRRLQ